eukprot:5522883-Prymnesium_polylepis.1
MGATAALQHAHLGSRTLAFGPRVDLRATHGSFVPPDACAACARAIESALGAAGGTVAVHVGEANLEDMGQAALLRSAPCVRLVRARARVANGWRRAGRFEWSGGDPQPHKSRQPATPQAVREYARERASRKAEFAHARLLPRRGLGDARHLPPQRADAPRARGRPRPPLQGRAPRTPQPTATAARNAHRMSHRRRSTHVRVTQIEA